MPFLSSVESLYIHAWNTDRQMLLKINVAKIALVIFFCA